MSADCVTYAKLSDNAVFPSKAHETDAGFDVTVINRKSNLSSDLHFSPVLYGTGLHIQPPEGYYFELVPRSSLQKLGYIFANSVGIIDNSYRGEIMVALVKFDESKPDIELPARVAQLIPRKMVNMKIQSVESLNETVRGTGGFGSTG